MPYVWPVGSNIDEQNVQFTAHSGIPSSLSDLNLPGGPASIRSEYCPSRVLETTRITSPT